MSRKTSSWTRQKRRKRSISNDQLGPCLTAEYADELQAYLLPAATLPEVAEVSHAVPLPPLSLLPEVPLAAPRMAELPQLKHEAMDEDEDTQDSTMSVCSASVCGEPLSAPGRGRFVASLQPEAQICAYCNAHFEAAKEFIDHLLLEHTALVKQTFVHEHCYFPNCHHGRATKTWENGNNIRVHLNAHFDIRNFGCGSCSRKFKCKKDLSSHSRTQLCKYCKESFTCAKLLNLHKKACMARGPANRRRRPNDSS